MPDQLLQLEETVDVYTIQATTFYQQGKILRTDPRYSMPELSPYYPVMLHQYQKTFDQNATNLVWFFKDRNNLAYKKSISKRKHALLLRCRIPKRFLLATNFSEWSMIINNQNLLFANQNKETGYDWCLLFDDPATLRNKVLRDYRTAFPDEQWSDDEIIDNKNDLQYVADRIEPQWIKSVKLFKGQG